LSAHFNLYYIFLEDKKKHPMPPEQKEKTWEALKEALKSARPP